MSKVVNAITATRSPNREVRRVQDRLFNDVFSVRDYHTQDALEAQYKVEVRLGAQCWISDDVKSSDNNVSFAVERTKRQVIEAIFGEFRSDFRLIERALYDRDVETARTALHDMEKRMFEVTESK